MPLAAPEDRTTVVLSQEHDNLRRTRDAVKQLKADGIAGLDPSIASIQAAMDRIEEIIAERCTPKGQVNAGASRSE